MISHRADILKKVKEKIRERTEMVPPFGVLVRKRKGSGEICWAVMVDEDTGWWLSNPEEVPSPYLHEERKIPITGTAASEFAKYDKSRGMS